MNGADHQGQERDQACEGAEAVQLQEQGRHQTTGTRHVPAVHNPGVPAVPQPAVRPPVRDHHGFSRSWHPRWACESLPTLYCHTKLTLYGAGAA